MFSFRKSSGLLENSNTSLCFFAIYYFEMGYKDVQDLYWLNIIYKTDFF